MAFKIIHGSNGSAIDIHADAIELSLASPVLRGAGTEYLFAGDLNLEQGADGLILGHAGELLFFAQVIPRQGDLKMQTRKVYQQVLEHIGHFLILRIWNYIPAINAMEGGVERYRAFCVGRAEAFGTHFQTNAMEPSYPAGSAVGIPDDSMVIFGVACRGKEKARFFENSRQIPAYQYPARYGPRPPSFSRASLFVGEESQAVYISGTASVIGHETHDPLQVDKQLQTTYSLLESLFGGLNRESAGSLPSDWIQRANGRLYLRRASDATVAEAWLRKHFPLAEGSWRIVEADLCRSDLVAEMELSFHPVAQSITRAFSFHA